MNVGVLGASGHMSTRAGDESLTCNSCRLRFDAIRRRPLALQCHHSYCEPCIGGMTTGRHGQKVTCSQCHTTTKLDNSRAGSMLPVNYSILDRLSVPCSTAPVSVRTGCESSLAVLGNVQEKVTVIPVNNKERPNVKPTGPKTCGKQLTTSNDAAGPVCITVTSSTNEAPSFCGMPKQEISAQMSPFVAPVIVPNTGPTITSLTVNGSATTIHPAQANCAPQPIQVDMCCQCRINPATLTVTNATQMSSQKLCSSCYALCQNKPEEEPEDRTPVAPRRISQNLNCTSDVPATTVIKVLDENSPTPRPPPPPAKSCEQSPCQPIPIDDGFHKGSIHVDGIKAPSHVQKKTKAKETAERTIIEEVTKEEGSNKPPIANLAYQACSKFDLRTTIPRVQSRAVKPATETCHCGGGQLQESVDEFSDSTVREEIYRPLPYNPNFMGNSPLTPIAPVLDSVPDTNDIQPLYPALTNPSSFNEKQPLPPDFQPSAPQYPFLNGAPPRYEEVVSQSDVPFQPAQQGHSAMVQVVHAFGRYGELATQPGAFRSPSRLNLSRIGILVVADPVHKTVQAFSPNGECLALIRVTGDSVHGCSCYDRNKLAVGTNAGVLIYDFNGLLKKTIPLGPVVNTVSVPGQGFIAVQPKALYIFKGPQETLIRSIRDRSKPGPVRQPIPFDNIADAAINSQKDIVVLDSGAASGLGSIFVLNEDGYLKSSIVPGREPCGVLRSPTAVAVDHAHNIIVSDAGNRRVLLFGPNGRFHRQLLGPGQIGMQSTEQHKVWPVGLDVADDGRLFVAARGDKYAEIRVFAYN